MSFTVLGFDYGAKRIGIATGQSITKTASPLTQITTHSSQGLWEQLDPIIDEWKPKCLVVGLPLNMDGSESKLSELATQFARALEKHYALETYLVDERLSTREAHAQLVENRGHANINKEELNSAAACVILQTWFNDLK